MDSIGHNNLFNNIFDIKKNLIQVLFLRIGIFWVK